MGQSRSWWVGAASVADLTGAVFCGFHQRNIKAGCAAHRQHRWEAIIPPYMSWLCLEVSGQYMCMAVKVYGTILLPYSGPESNLSADDLGLPGVFCLPHQNCHSCRLKKVLGWILSEPRGVGVPPLDPGSNSRYTSKGVQGLGSVLRPQMGGWWASEHPKMVTNKFTVLWIPVTLLLTNLLRNHYCRIK